MLAARPDSIRQQTCLSRLEMSSPDAVTPGVPLMLEGSPLPWGWQMAGAAELPVAYCGKEHQQVCSLYPEHVLPTILCPNTLRKNVMNVQGA